jgi:hypothetical protein
MSSSLNESYPSRNCADCNSESTYIELGRVKFIHIGISFTRKLKVYDLTCRQRYIMSLCILLIKCYYYLINSSNEKKIIQAPRRPLLMAVASK